MEQEELLEEENYELDEEMYPEEEYPHERDAQSKALLDKIKKCIKIVKWIVIAAGIVAGVLLVYGILTVTVFKDAAETAMIGLIVLLVVEGLLFVAFAVMLVLAKLQLNKLKKLN